MPTRRASENDAVVRSRRRKQADSPLEDDAGGALAEPGSPHDRCAVNNRADRDQDAQSDRSGAGQPSSARRVGYRGLAASGEDEK